MIHWSPAASESISICMHWSVFGSIKYYNFRPPNTTISFRMPTHRIYLNEFFIHKMANCVIYILLGWFAFYNLIQVIRLKLINKYAIDISEYLKHLRDIVTSPWGGFQHSKNVFISHWYCTWPNSDCNIYLFCEPNASAVQVVHNNTKTEWKFKKESF